MSDREYDLAVFGASGFVGRLVARRLAEARTELRIALAGRSRERLVAVADDLGVDWPVVVTDSGDPAALADLAGSTRVVLTTVGPYARHGLPLVLACARAGTAYGDLTGEALFVRESIDTADTLARTSDARIVHSCGFDSVPSDLGVQMVAERAAADGAGELSEVLLMVVAAAGGVSGGTVDSLRGQVDSVRRDPALARRLADPYLLSPDRDAEPDLGPQPDAFLARRLEDGTWTAPFVMAPFNTRVVRRSNALLGHAWGRELRYAEAVRTGRAPWSPVLAGGVALGTAAVAAGLRTPVVRPLLDRILPDPGEGPSPQAQQAGSFRLELRAVTTTGARYTGTVAAPGDPGYAATSVMLAQSGLSLAQDDLPDRSGVLTPAVAMGSALTERLRAAGFTFTVQPTG
ncbi:saccharopine dehydrogenase family protein [Nakamurella deserti]|uniref:saccharopine dehydrogenase family protein n=1 Tax=Nakamurella deserti TaxID=2164074 RepID=UPI000DBE7EBE|nr:saccharopine dehydrogenase NADP-binding domain-containing protein [Nakamurella deserti]